MMDPTDSRLVTGTVEQQEQARRQIRREQRIQEAIRCKIEQLELADLEVRKFDIVHVPTGRIFYRMLGDPFSTVDPAPRPRSSSTPTRRPCSSIRRRHMLRRGLASSPSGAWSVSGDATCRSRSPRG
jgi:hypothetical protein